MFDLTVSTQHGAPFYGLENCDKDGSLVAKRLASVNRGVSDTRRLGIKIDRQVDGAYLNDMAARVVGPYEVHGQGILDSPTLVLGSVHRPTLYVAECLHAPVLPLQFIGFAQAGSDGGANEIWLWNKIVDRAHLPPCYLRLIKHARQLVVVRSTYLNEGVLRRYRHLYVHSSLRCGLLEEIGGEVDEVDDATVGARQWERGLPDAAILMLKSLWREAGKADEDLLIVEERASALYDLAARLWERYLLANNVVPRGISFNAYWVAHLYFERALGLIPVNYYSFKMHKKLVLELVGRHRLEPICDVRLCHPGRAQEG